MLLLYYSNPIAYTLLKAAAHARHVAVHLLEGGNGHYAGTWHQALMDQVYPL